MKRILLAAILATTAATGIAYAEQDGVALPAATKPRPGMPPRGDMTRAEAQTRAAEMFARLDANHDGKLDPADRAARVAQMFDRIDADHNGQISRAEFAATHDRDPGRDGGPDGMGPGGPGGPDGPPPPPPPGAMTHGRDHEGPHGGHGGRPGGPGGPGGMMAMARMADADGNGAISQAEFTAAALKRFDAADTNHDGKLTEAERRAGHDRMRGPGGPGGAMGDMARPMGDRSMKDRPMGRDDGVPMPPPPDDDGE